MRELDRHERRCRHFIRPELSPQQRLLAFGVFWLDVIEFIAPRIISTPTASSAPMLESPYFMLAAGRAAPTGCQPAWSRHAQLPPFRLEAAALAWLLFHADGRRARQQRFIAAMMEYDDASSFIVVAMT